MKAKVLTTLAVIFLSALLTQFAQAQCQPLYVFTGKAALDYFGYTVSGAGDVNNDGYDDVVIGAKANHTNNPDSAGQVFVFSGLDGDTLYLFTGANALERFGYSAAGAGDLNNDGYSDIIVGAPLNSDSGAEAGKVYIFSGLDGDTLYQFWGFEAGDRFGSSVAGAGDINNDNYDDIIIGSPLSDLAGFNNGEAGVISGLDGEYFIRFYGSYPDDEFGTALASAGDVDNDGRSDVIFGVPLGDIGETNAGQASVFSGGATVLAGIYMGDVVNEHLGNAVASAGDVDNDGFDDVIIGANRYNAAQSAGRAYVFDVHDQDTLHIFSGASGDWFGTAVGPMGDINKDGYDDVLVSAFESDGALIDAGRVFVLSGFNGDTLHVFEGESSLDEFGWSAASAGDVDNDGFNDVIVGAECNSANGNCAGRVYVYSCCCLGNRGDFNGDGNNSTIVDLNYLVNDIFRGGPSAACATEADLNDDGNSSTIVDLNFLVNDIFRGGPSVGACY